MESGRRNFIMGYDPLGWGGNIHGIRKKKFYHGIRPFRVGGGNIHGIRKKKFYHGIRPFRVGGGNIHGIRKKKFYHGIRPFRVGGGTFMESGRRNFITVYDLLGWGGEHSWNQEEEILSWDTTL